MHGPYQDPPKGPHRDERVDGCRWAAWSCHNETASISLQSPPSMPRKSQVDLISISGIVSAQAQQELVTEGLDNFELPKSLVTSIARSSLPDNAKLPKDTILALVKGSTVFINHLGAPSLLLGHVLPLSTDPPFEIPQLERKAYDVAMSKQHKSISAADVMRALEILELGDMVETIQEDLQAFRDEQRAAGKASSHDSMSAPPSRRLSVQPGAPTIRIKPPKKETPSRATSLSSYSRRQDKDEEQHQDDQAYGEATPGLYHNWQSGRHPDDGKSDKE
ncbi:hypothetical protein DFS33DRAFT_348369 [Desarmillaria ectypa]|nr:hypothetical protein DFS33DRAFT_348369 [Desarmillaria ectypa]